MLQVNWQLERQDGYPGEHQPDASGAMFLLVLVIDEGLSLQEENA